MTPKAKKRSPLRDKPLRLPGQSLEEQINDERINMFALSMYPIFMIALSVTVWLGYFFPSKHKFTSPIVGPSILTLIALFFVTFYGIKIYRITRKINLLRMARDGERIVGEELQSLIQNGAAVLHDVIGNKFNIDHVVICTQGIYVVETKTYSKPTQKDARITIAENHILVDGKKVDREPINQAKALSKWIQNLLLESTGKKFSVKPVILFPGWFVEPLKGKEEVWVLNPKALPTFIKNEPVSIKETDVHLITFHLSRYIRTHPNP